MNKKPICAILYDFDSTLATTDMQNFGFIPALGLTPAEFWGETTRFSNETGCEKILSYLYTMIAMARQKGIKLDKAFLRECGKNIKFFPGVTYSEADAKAVDLSALDFAKPTFEKLMANQSKLNGCKSVLSYLALDNKWASKGKEYDFCVSSIADLNRFYRQTVALYNADVAGYNYWRSLPFYRAFFHLFGFKTRPNIP